MKLAIFDFDGTLFPKDTLTFLLKQWYRLKYPKLKLYKAILPLIPAFLKYKLDKNISKDEKEEMRVQAILGFNRLMTGMTKEEIDKFFYLSSAAINTQLNPVVLERVEQSNRDGYHTVLLSGAYSLLLQHVRDFLHIDNVIGSEIYFDQGVFYNNIASDFVTGSNKVNKLKSHFMNENIDWQESLAFADSESDLQVLELVRQPTAVCPEPKLREIALERNWEII